MAVNKIIALLRRISGRVARDNKNAARAAEKLPRDARRWAVANASAVEKLDADIGRDIEKIAGIEARPRIAMSARPEGPPASTSSDMGGAATLELSVAQLGERIARESVVVGSSAMNAAFGVDLRRSGDLDIAVSDGAYRYLREQAGWVERAYYGGTLLESGAFQVGRGWTRQGLEFDVLLSRAWRTPEGVRVASLPDVYAWKQERCWPKDVDDTAMIRRRLQSLDNPPLSRFVLDRQMRAVRATLPAHVLDHPNAETAVLLAANGMHIVHTLYGHPEVGRANQIIGDLELINFRVPALYHNGFGLERDAHLLQLHLDNIRAPNVDRLDALVIDFYSDSAYGNGRRSNNPTGYDELRSADLARAHALALGYDQDRADRIHHAILGTGFDETTKVQVGRFDPDLVTQAAAGIDLQILAEPESLEAAVDLAVEDGMSARYSAARVIGNALGSDVKIRSGPEAMKAVDEVRSNPKVRDMLGDRLMGNGFFADPMKGHQYPPTWTLDNPAMRSDHAQASVQLGQRFKDGEITATRLRELAQEHTEKMREKYG